MAHHLVVYTRGAFCPDVQRARGFLRQYNVSHVEINIDVDLEARARVLDWNGCLSVPTLVVCEEGSVLPCEAPSPLAPGQSPRDVDRGSMISEASGYGLRQFLTRHGFLPSTV
jgi:glutaredoxin